MLILPLSPGFFFGRIHLATKMFFWLVVAAHFVFHVLLPEEALDFFALHSSDSLSWSYLSYAYLHGNLWHLLVNLVFFIPFSVIVEEKLGFGRTVALHVVSAVGAGWGWSLLNDVPAPLVGASGVVAAMMGASMMLRPHVRVPGVWLILIFPVLFFAAPAWLWASVYFLLDSIEFFSSLGSVNISGIAYEAHIAGFLAGFLLSWWAIGRGWVRAASSDLLGTLRQAARQPAPQESIPFTGTINFNHLDEWLLEVQRRLEKGESVNVETLLSLARLSEQYGRGVEVYRLLKQWHDANADQPGGAAEIAAELGFLSLRTLARPDLAQAWLQEALRQGVRGDLEARVLSALRVL